MDYKKFYQSKAFIIKKILYGIGIIIVALLIFKAGTFVGYRKAAFSYGLGENYYRAFGKHREGIMGERNMPGFLNFPNDRDFSNPYGPMGKIIKVESPTLILEDRDSVEKIVLIKDNTVIRRFRDTIKLTDLKPGDFIVVIGSPNNQGQIEAKFIRVMPASPQTMNQMMNAGISNATNTSTNTPAQ
jgi:hypothetical protein